MSATKKCKILLVGDGGVGKTTFVKRHLTGEFETKYVATMGVEVHPLSFHSNIGMVEFTIWDVAGQDKFGGLRDGYFIGAQAAIIMYDVTNNVSAKRVSNWYRDVVRVCDGIPIVVVASKSDTSPEQPRYSLGAKLENKLGVDRHLEVQIKANVNMEAPFVTLGKDLFGKSFSLQDVPALAPAPQGPAPANAEGPAGIDLTVISPFIMASLKPDRAPIIANLAAKGDARVQAVVESFERVRDVDDAIETLHIISDLESSVL